MTNKLISAMVTLVIGLALLPVINDFVTDLTEGTGPFVDTTTGSLIALLPVLYVIIIVVGFVAFLGLSKHD